MHRTKAGGSRGRKQSADGQIVMTTHNRQTIKNNNKKLRRRSSRAGLEIQFLWTHWTQGEGEHRHQRRKWQLADPNRRRETRGVRWVWCEQWVVNYHNVSPPGSRTAEIRWNVTALGKCGSLDVPPTFMRDLRRPWTQPRSTRSTGAHVTTASSETSTRTTPANVFKWTTNQPRLNHRCHHVLLDFGLLGRKLFSVYCFCFY